MQVGRIEALELQARPSEFRCPPTRSMRKEMAMPRAEIFVQSRWSRPSQHGYEWRPFRPNQVDEILGMPEVTSENFERTSLWQWTGRGKRQELWLIVSGVDAGYSDWLARPVRHTVLWSTTRAHEKLLRQLLIDAALGDLQDRVRAAISLDELDGFAVDTSYLSESNQKLDFFPKAAGADTLQCAAVEDFVRHIRSHRIPIAAGDATPALLAITGVGLKPGAIDSFPTCKWQLYSEVPLK